MSERTVPPLPVRPRVLLLSGDRAVGKSTLCERLAREARERSIPTGGIVCPGVFDRNGEKTGCRARDVRTGQEWPLGSRERDLGGPRWKAWSFSEEGFLRANGAVLDALERGTGLVLIDEIGPVEWELGAGLQPSLRRLDSLLGSDTVRGPAPETHPGPGILVILVVRPELRAALSARYPASIAETITAENREETFRRVSGSLYG